MHTIGLTAKTVSAVRTKKKHGCWFDGNHVPNALAMVMQGMH